MQTVSRLTTHSIKSAIFSRVQNVALGNSKTGFKEVASDLLNDQGRDQIKNICQGTFLSRATIERVMDLTETEKGGDYHPQSETLERIFRYCNAEANFTEVKIKPKFRNIPKEDH